MDLPLALTLLLAGLLCYWIYVYLRKRCNYFADLGIPYVPPWPIFGNMGPVCFRRKHIIQTVEELYDYHPDAKYVGVFDLVRPVLMIRDPELIKSVLIKHFDNFMDRWEFVDAEVDPLMGKHLFTLRGADWREMRNILSPAFTSNKIKFMYEPMTQCARNLVEYLFKEGLNEREIDAKDMFRRYTNDVIVNYTLNLQINSFEDRFNEFLTLGYEATDFEGKFFIKFFFARAFPWLMKVFRLRLVSGYVANFFETHVRQIVKMREETGVRRPDMIQLMMDARNKTSIFKLNIPEMTSQVFSFFFGGFDTTSSQMCIIAHELILNPEIQKRLQSEIDEVLASSDGKTPSYEAINAMPYLDAIFNESMRLRPQANVIDRLCTKDFELPPAKAGCKPITLRAGTNVWIPVAAIHVDEAYYEKPRVFDPDRFLNKKVTINQVKNLGFGIGPRACIGIRLATLQTKVLFFHLLANFNLKHCSKTAKNFDYRTTNICVAPKGGYWFSVEPRK